MAQFQALSQLVEVNGQTVMSVVSGMGAFKDTALQILKKNGIDNPKPDMWYKQQAWLDAFKEIAGKLGPRTLMQIGLKIPESAKFPPEINTIDKALGAIDIAYHMNHRNGQIGNYAFTKTGDRTAKLVCNNPYPCDFDKGIITAMATKFKPASALVQVDHDAAGGCRSKGGNACTYLVKW